MTIRKFAELTLTLAGVPFVIVGAAVSAVATESGAWDGAKDAIDNSKELYGKVNEKSKETYHKVFLQGKDDPVLAEEEESLAEAPRVLGLRPQEVAR